MLQISLERVSIVGADKLAIRSKVSYSIELWQLFGLI